MDKEIVKTRDGELRVGNTAYILRYNYGTYRVRECKVTRFTAKQIVVEYPNKTFPGENVVLRFRKNDLELVGGRELGAISAKLYATRNGGMSDDKIEPE